MAGENNARGSRVSFRSSSEVQRPRASGTLTPTRREDGVKRTSAQMQLIQLMTIILIAVRVQRERKVISEAPKEQLDDIVPDLSAAEGEPGVQDQEELKGQRTVTEAQPGVLVENPSEVDHVGQDRHDTAQPGRSSGELW